MTIWGANTTPNTTLSNKNKHLLNLSNYVRIFELQQQQQQLLTTQKTN